jgi:type I restriction enzyme S subunit
MARYRFDEIAENSIEKRKPLPEDKDRYIGLEHLDPGSLVVSRWGAEVAPIGVKLVMKKGDVLFGRRRAYQKKVAIAPFDGIFSAHGMVLRPRKEIISEKLFPFFISSDYFLNSAISISVGSLSPTINWQDLKELTFSIPPMDKQDKIADVFISMHELKEAYVRLLDATEELVKLRFLEIFGDMKTNPFGWEQSTIGECCTLKSGTTLPIEVENEGGPIPYVKVGDMNYPGNERYIVTSSRYVSEATAEKKLFEVGSVLFPKRGGAISTNKKRMTKLPVCADLNVMGVSSNGKLLPEYLLAYFDMIDLGALADGSSVPQINNKNIAPLVISIPPMEEQEKFSTFIEQSDKLKFVVQNSLEKLNDSIQAFTNHVFS